MVAMMRRDEMWLVGKGERGPTRRDSKEEEDG
jgi:hypothetical protein